MSALHVVGFQSNFSHGNSSSAGGVFFVFVAGRVKVCRTETCSKCKVAISESVETPENSGKFSSVAVCNDTDLSLYWEASGLC